MRVYVQNYIGRYVFGRMYYDADYEKQTLFYLNDLINQRNLDEFDAKKKFREEFPMEFKEAVGYLKKLNRKRMQTNNSALAEYFSTDDSTIARWMDNAKYYKNEDFLVMLCLFFRLPDWISRLLFKRAHVQLDEDDRRSAALMRILRVQSEDGLEAANNYLKSQGLDMLHV